MGKSFKSDDFLPVRDLESMAAQVLSLAPASDADVLKLLRARFPDTSLSARVAALDYLMRHQPRSPGGTCAAK